MGERERSCMCYICMPAFVRAFVRECSAYFSYIITTNMGQQ